MNKNGQWPYQERSIINGKSIHHKTHTYDIEIINRKSERNPKVSKL